MKTKETYFLEIKQVGNRTEKKDNEKNEGLCLMSPTEQTISCVHFFQP